jgi:hypothetical protein
MNKERSLGKSQFAKTGKFVLGEVFRCDLASGPFLASLIRDARAYVKAMAAPKAA